MADLWLWIIIVVLIVIIAILVLAALKSKFLYFSGIDASLVVTRKVNIPVGDIELNAKLILPKFTTNEQGDPIEPLPLVFFNPGWGMSIDMILILQYACPLAIGGPYAVLTYDCRGEGKSPGMRKLDDSMLDDFPRIFEFGENLKGIDKKRMGFVGVSFGAMVALSSAYPDDRFKAIVAISAVHDAKENFSRKPESFRARLALGYLGINGVKGSKITDEVNKKISPKYILKPEKKDLNERVMLIHARNDSIVHFGQFEKNREVLGLTDTQAYILEKGGHTFFSQELNMLGRALGFLKNKL
ncbi:MAG: alpha/beta hydrolase family protein [Candidatus Hodarchaeota archaeon]